MNQSILFEFTEDKKKSFSFSFDGLQLEISDYNVAADIRKEANGLERLYHESYQYRKNGRSAQNSTQRWACSKKDSLRCSATASTVDVDGVQMMKLMVTEHCHQP